MKLNPRKFLAGVFGLATLGAAAPVPQSLAPVAEKQQVAIDQVKPKRETSPQQRYGGGGGRVRVGKRTYRPRSINRAISRGHAVVAWTSKENSHGYQDLGVFVGRSQVLSATFRHGFGRNPMDGSLWEPHNNNPARQ